MKDLFAAPPPPSPETGAGIAAMTDLTERLAGPDGPAAAAALVERFDALGRELTLEMTNGTAPDRFRALDAVRTAVVHAKQILAAVTRS